MKNKAKETTERKKQFNDKEEKLRAVFRRLTVFMCL